MTNAQEKPRPITSPCRECGSQVRRQRARGVSRSQFCSTKCSNRWWARARNRGGQAYALLMEWRTTRGNRKGVMGDLAHLVDQWIAEDKSKGQWPYGLARLEGGYGKSFNLQPENKADSEPGTDTVAE